MSRISDFLHPLKPTSLVFYSSSAGGYVALGLDTPGPFATLDEALAVAGAGAVVGDEKTFAAIWAAYRDGAFEGADESSSTEGDT